MNIVNPFEHFFPENLSPEEICRLFVDEYTEHNALTARKHTFVEGSRGSGKSMLLRYLEPSCRKHVCGGWDNFINEKNAFIGVYINCNTGDFNIKEYNELLESSDVPRVLSEKVLIHEFIMRIVEWTIKTIFEQLNEYTVQNQIVCNTIIKALDEKNIYDDVQKYHRSLDGIKAIVKSERKKVHNAIIKYLEKYSIIGNSFDYDGNYVDTSFRDGAFLPIFFSSLVKLLDIPKMPFYLLFDEASDNTLLPLQQKIINTLITQRIHELLCIKVSMRPESYSNDTDLYDKPIQYIHDYEKINIDSLYTNNTESYYRRVREIANRRLQLAGFSADDIMVLLPESNAEKEKMKEAETLTSDEYDNLSDEKKISDKKNYIYKYARARFFQFYTKKSTYMYTGFDNLVHFSSGITRAFLDPCFDMIEKFMQKYPNKDIKSIEAIPYEIQWESIRNFSNDFVDIEILNRIRRRSTESRERIILEKLFNLIESLGNAYKIRLNNEKSRYPRIISFSLRETLVNNQEVEEVMKRALQDCFFHKRWYRGKSGYEMLECYIFNRRLCPRYGLDLSGFQGRIELSKDSLILAMNDRDKFIEWFREKEKTGDTEQATQLELFGY